MSKVLGIKEKSKPSNSLVDQIVKNLLKAIFDGSYQPGANLREMRIAREYGISQATVREALQQLEAAGLVTREANVGTTVTRLSPKEVRERVELRACLEVRAAEEAALRMRPEDFVELERRLATLAKAIQTDAYYEAAQADLEFHRYIWICSGNETLCQVLNHLTVPLLAFVSVLRASGLEHLVDVTAAHEPLVEALRSRQVARIAEVFAGSVYSSYEQFMDVTAASRRAQAFGMMVEGKPGPSAS